MPVGGGMRRIIRSRLPERFRAAIPPLATEIAVGVLSPLLLFGIRWLKALVRP